MKKVSVIIVALCLFTTYLSAQSTVVVSTGAGYENDVYYSFTEGSLVTRPRAEWDIAFSTEQFDVNILANHASGVEIYTYPDGNISAWENLDVSNIANWSQSFNSIVNLTEGAFLRNIDASDVFDFGWGKYNPGTHKIIGDSLYVVKTVNGDLKKLWIVEKNPLGGSNFFDIKYANIDGSEEQNVIISCDPYETKNFVYFLMDQNMLIDREPASDSWELQFTKYHDYTIPYNVTGITLNSFRVLAHQVDYVNQEDFEEYDEANFNDSLIVIGSDWKSFTGTGYSVDEDRVYFVKVYDAGKSDSTYYKLYFTEFGGSANGNYTFVQKDLATSSSNDIPGLGLFELYPNPVSAELNVLIDLNTSARIKIMDMQGRIIRQTNSENAGFSKHKINISELESGTYALVIESEKGSSSRIFVKK